MQLGASLWWPAPTEPTLLMQAKAGILLGQPTFILVLTFMVRLRRELAARERAHHQGKERLLAMISHDIRGPLQTMLTSVDLLATKAQDPASVRAVQRLEAVAGQLDRHLRDLIAFNQLDSPDLTVEHRRYDLAALVTACCEQHEPQAQRQGLGLHLTLTPPPAGRHEGDMSPLSWHHAQGDPDRVRQVLDNLLVNALKYTPSGSITVSLRHEQAHPGWARIDVSDTGPGIDAEQQASIFQPFVRLEDARRGGHDGSGLGLAIAARLAERLGGEIRLDSTPGQGSRFSLRLPLNRRA